MPSSSRVTMPPKRNATRNTGVRGPNSALTEFLRNEGITDAFRRRRDEQLTTVSPLDLTPSEEPIPEPEDDDIVVIRQAGREKRRRARGDPDSDGDDDYSDDSSDDEYNEKKFGEDDICVECETTFPLSVYSRYLPVKKGYLCELCNHILKKKEQLQKRNQVAARKKRKKVALALLDKQKVRIPKLQDVCIRCITASIHDVEALGDIGEQNVNKISRILSKNRSLSSQTIGLFLQPDLRKLEFWDCLNVDLDLFNKIAAYCPNLESLTLFMCGQLHNDNLKYYATNLLQLKELKLNGPFLVSNEVWQEFFESSCAKNLTAFEVRNTHRMNNDTMICLLENMGKNLNFLKLLRLDGFDSAEVYSLLPHYISELTHLELSYPHKPELVTDELLINILAVTGESLVELNVDGCSALTDRFLTEGVSLFCPSLTRFSARDLGLLTDEGVASAFDAFKMINTGLISADFTKCVGLGDKAAYALLEHSASTLVELSLNSWYNLTKDFLMQIVSEDSHPYKKGLEEKGEQFWNFLSFPLLTTADVGFVRAMDDEVLELLLQAAPKLTIVEVFGDNRCTFKVSLRRDLLVIGRQEF